METVSSKQFENFSLIFCVHFKAKTKDPRLTPERQAKATMTADPYDTKGKNYIHIGVPRPQKHNVNTWCLIHSLQALILQVWIQLSWN